MVWRNCGNRNTSFEPCCNFKNYCSKYLYFPNDEMQSSLSKKYFRGACRITSVISSWSINLEWVFNKTSQQSFDIEFFFMENSFCYWAKNKKWLFFDGAFDHQKTNIIKRCKKSPPLKFFDRFFLFDF